MQAGDRLKVVPSGRESRVARIVTADGDLPYAIAGQCVTITLTDEVDVSRGDVLVDMQALPQTADQFEATLIGLGETAIFPGRSYLMKLATKVVTATVNPLKYRVDVNTLERLAAERLELNDIGVVELELDQPIAFEEYAKSRELGGFILIQGTQQQIDSLRRDDDFQRWLNQVQLVADRVGIVDAWVNQGLAEAISLYEDALRKAGLTS